MKQLVDWQMVPHVGFKSVKMDRGCVKLELRLWLCCYLDVVCVLLSSAC
jgi:hypothetical protein